ncbi:glycosyltransferase family 4 protein [Gracilimonas tropica]|uniref:glycosyltransferase family 4 protein n=1 Tax=Gracilimonas tropica TaxID=454600 RepID=UPI00037FE943|nr:glycosyltransferase family 4 protein [Gracilimonas tropica]
MNIIQVCPYDLSIPGGVQSHVTQLSNELTRKNHNVMVFAPSLTKSSLERKFDCEVKYLTKAKRVGIWGTSVDISVLNSTEKERTLDIIKNFNPDVVHFHTIWNPLMQTQLLGLLPKGVKKVGTFHDTPPDFGIGKYVGGNLMRLAAKYYLPKVDEIISVSKTQANAMGVNFQNPPGNFRILPNGIDADAGDGLSPTPPEKNEFRLIFIGRFESRKGVFDLLEVYRRLKEGDLGQDVTLKMLGNGPLLPKAKTFVEENRLEGISFFEQTSDDEKNQMLLDSDLLVAPSLYGESFGIVLLEGMALGVKVAGYGNDGYLNIGRKYGVDNFPPPGDTDALFELLKKHIQSPEEMEALIEKGLKIAGEHDWKLLTEKIEKIYAN